jgi:hypothetical protein
MYCKHLKKNTMKKSILIFILAIAFCHTSIAQTPGVVISEKAGWHKIAERHVGLKTDRDEILVVGAGHFKQIKLKVEDAPISLTSFDVYFDNDAKQTIAVNKQLNNGDETMPADIDNTHAIKKITLVYTSLGSTKTGVSTKTSTNQAGEKEVEKENERENEKEHAEVEIWGLK